MSSIPALTPSHLLTAYRRSLIDQIAAKKPGCPWVVQYHLRATQVIAADIAPICVPLDERR